jgi:hypothetical protein
MYKKRYINFNNTPDMIYTKVLMTQSRPLHPCLYNIVTTSRGSFINIGSETNIEKEPVPQKVVWK